MVNEKQCNPELYTKIWRNLISLYKILYKKVESKFNENNISVLEYRILRILKENGKMTMANLADENYVTQAWITGMIDKMETKGLVSRNRSDTDRRVIYISATEKGEKFIDEMRIIHDEILAEAFSFMNEEEARKVLKILEELKGNLEEENKVKIEKKIAEN
ncbi:MarR family winged helix-turn-helix transcriptional regulator [Cuniculiplasma sp. SKW3]|uniref:MarR family winged helix-turn-helix transcriptional regulator n=1 Tax=Cuniculiplasma sp. SKW3 TaxID=3400170 RepID=UPI003FD5E5AB